MTKTTASSVFDALTATGFVDPAHKLTEEELAQLLSAIASYHAPTPEQEVTLRQHLQKQMRG